MYNMYMSNVKKNILISLTYQFVHVCSWWLVLLKAESNPSSQLVVLFYKNSMWKRQSELVGSIFITTSTMEIATNGYFCLKFVIILSFKKTHYSSKYPDLICYWYTYQQFLGQLHQIVHWTQSSQCMNQRVPRHA